MKIKKAVIPAAGLGTRVLPATKSMPKEMLPIVDKPAIQYIVEEAVNSGIEDILIVVSRGKTTVEDHFDRSPELEKRLLETNKKEVYNNIVNITKMANIVFVRQQEQKGLGHAILQTKSFVGDEPFAVLYGDDVIIGDDPACGQLCRAYEEYGLATVGIKQVSEEAIQKYSSLKTSFIKNNIYSVSDMIEKPKKNEILSLYSIQGRCILPAEIFKILENTPAGAGNEIQLTDAMKVLATTKGMLGVDFTGKRFDMGSKLGILEATVEVALKHPEVKDEFRNYLKNVVSTL